MPDEHEHCPLTGREAGEILSTLKTIQGDIEEIKTLVQKHEAALNQAYGIIAIVGLIAAALGAITAKIFKW